eukprot:CAMPEP_0172601116 /NCGR_PEP_ID=MMETSP1068-20121228/21267_1 /TAXON_ID=35684 /ORGANISM="Pseudopedinella elastica, Strain CCMP716" /LENGTH=32 /DNA_ID= /DNA_START= /DNA_END= /DNA_ORIENTATION=
MTLKKPAAGANGEGGVKGREGGSNRDAFSGQV